MNQLLARWLKRNLSKKSVSIDNRDLALAKFCAKAINGANWELRGELGNGGVLACKAMCVKK